MGGPKLCWVLGPENLVATGAELGIWNTVEIGKYMWNLFSRKHELVFFYFEVSSKF